MEKGVAGCRRGESRQDGTPKTKKRRVAQSVEKGRKKGSFNKRAAGAEYEQKAAEYLRGLGYRIVAVNYRCRLGEIDLIGVCGAYLVFIEVKYRRDGRSGSGLEAVDYRKQSRILQAARWYLMEKQLPADTPCRFDVVSFLGDEVTLVQDAFQA